MTVHPSIVLSCVFAFCLSACGSDDVEGDSVIDADGDGVAAEEDCDDSDPSVQTEVLWYLDSDGDGYGSTALESCQQPDGYSADGQDCNDASNSVHPGADELCNGIDDDCSGEIDENDAVDALTWYPDADNDGYGSNDESTVACEQPEDHILDSGDCDDNDALVNPDAVEVCDEADVDENCDGVADDESAVGQATWYRDADNDEYGGASDITHACDDPSDGDHWVANATDCDDHDPDIHPGAEELCDGIDNDCNSATGDLNSVLFTDTSGTTTDMTATFEAGRSASPASISISAGSVEFCGGPYYVALTTGGATELSGVGNPTLSGGDSVMVIRHGAGTLTISGLTIAHGNAEILAGGLTDTSSSTITLEDVVFSDNFGRERGGAIWSNGTIVCTDSTFTDNESYGHGGAIYLTGEITTTGCEFTGNVATSSIGSHYGGAIYIDNESSTSSFTDTTFTDNTGDGVYSTGQPIECVKSTPSASAGFYRNSNGVYWSSTHATSRRAELVSDGCDWGSGSTDNRYGDLIIVYGGDPYWYGDDAYFTCTSDGCD